MFNSKRTQWTHLTRAEKEMMKEPRKRTDQQRERKKRRNKKMNAVAIFGTKTNE